MRCIRTQIRVPKNYDAFNAQRLARIVLRTHKLGIKSSYVPMRPFRVNKSPMFNCGVDTVHIANDAEEKELA